MRAALTLCLVGRTYAPWGFGSYTYDSDVLPESGVAVAREIGGLSPAPPPASLSPPPSASPAPAPTPSPPPGPPPPGSPAPPPQSECWYRGTLVDYKYCVQPPPPEPSPPPPPPPSPMPPPPPYFMWGNGTNATAFAEPDLYTMNMLYLGCCATILGAAAYSYAKAGDPSSTAGAATRSVRVLTGMSLPPPSGKAAPAEPKAVYSKLPKPKNGHLKPPPRMMV